MSVLIKGMEMPKSCSECRFCAGTFEGCVCTVGCGLLEFEPSKEIHPKCPLVAEQRWIPTSERPPKDFENVYVQDKIGCVDICKYVPKRIKPKEHPDGFWGDTDYYEYDYFDIVAWMPLPEPYKEAENEG